AVYRDQLAELERDQARGVLSAADAEAARNVVARRLLKAEGTAEAGAPASVSGRRPVFLASAALVPIIAMSLYLAVGRPDLPDLPRSERLAHAVENNDFPAMIAQVEAHLAQNPNDAEGWVVLAPAYRRLGRYAEAADAYARAASLAPPNAKLQTELGETLVLANEGLVVAEARKAFESALKLDGQDMKARFYRALAAKQEGKREEALKGFQDMLAEGPKDAPWRSAVEKQVASLAGPVAPALSDEQMAAGEGMSAEARQTMIRGMVDGLATRLKQNGKDLDGWLRLARARVVLGEKPAAAAALAEAEAQFKGDEASLARIADARRSLGLETTQ
ncbi:MAG: c-type cytochrome biogenesis protein CcmI, partial [Parvibaculaceae bacterium]